MMKKTTGWATRGLLVTIALGACTNIYLKDERRLDKLPSDRAMTVEGEFCTPSPNEVVRPIKILLAMDASQSMNVNDPDGTRATAMIDLFNALPNDPEIFVAVMVFAGSTTGWLTKSGLPRFDQLVTLTASDRNNIAGALLNFVNPAPMTSPNRDSTDFVKPLEDIYAMISDDISSTRVGRDGGINETRARYSVIFLSDGHPTNNQDRELLCDPSNAVERLHSLADQADDVRLNTVHVALPRQPIPNLCDVMALPPAGAQSCGIPDIPPGPCPLLLINADAMRLSEMARLGGGDFRDFRNNEPVNFLNFAFGNTRRTFNVQVLVANNFSAPPGSPLDQADTDGDGLLDADEIIEGTDMWDSDTDNDGFSDGVEVFFRGQGNMLNPRNIGLPDGGGYDPGCPPSLRGVDSDCDGLTDCDEQLVGTNPNRTDSDNDGVPDAFEWQMGTQPAGKDLAQDPDNDSITNYEEVLMHMDPGTVDSSKLTQSGYRYSMERNGRIDDEGRQCFTFRIDNVLLAPTEADTRDAGNPDGGEPLYRRGAGYNDIVVSVSMVPSDDPNGRSIVKTYRNNSSRYPVGGIKSPVDGVIHVANEDFVDKCGARVTTP